MARRWVGPILIILLGGLFASQLWAQDNDGDQGRSAHHAKIISFEVGTDETLSYPVNLVNLPDEHTTIMPLKFSNPDPEAPSADEDTYLVFASSKVFGGNGGTVVLETTDLKNFTDLCTLRKGRMGQISDMIL